eukprot:3274684-Amphidinium_carterae.1
MTPGCRMCHRSYPPLWQQGGRPRDGFCTSAFGGPSNHQRHHRARSQTMRCKIVTRRQALLEAFLFT